MLGNEILDLSDQAANFSEQGPGVTRALGTPEHRQLLVALTKWMQQAGLETHIDAAGNLVGRTPFQHGKKTLIIGSHQDTVRQGGKYDGMLGILLPLVVLKSLKGQFDQLGVNVELVAFSDEEGARFSSTLVGSSALAGRFKKEILTATDKDGVTLADALVSLGGNPEEIDQVARDPKQVCGFLEVHIEQGPVLESLDLPVGVVTAITGIERHHVVVTGKANHAGTTPMEHRQDALVAATHVVQVVNEVCLATPDLVGVVGELNVTPNAVNVIPSKVELTIELRSPKIAIRLSSRDKIMSLINERLSNTSCQWHHQLKYEQTEVVCSDAMQQRLEDAILTQGFVAHRLFSGAGHDGLAMASLCEIGMLFVRCKEGLSHHPDEAITAKDAEVAAQVLKSFLLAFNQESNHVV
jgi:allantoate deiminase